MLLIWAYSLVSIFLVSLASFIGALVLSISTERLNRMIFILVSLAVGALFGDAFIHIIPEIFEEATNPATLSLSILLGVLIFFVLEKVLLWHHYHDTEEGIHSIRHVGHINLVSDGFHNFIDGLFIATAYLVSIPLGIATTAAVLLHELPQEIGDFGILIHSGFTVRRALFYNFLSSLTAFFGAFVVFIIGPSITEIAPLLLALTAGGFIYIAGSDLVPELHKTNDPKRSLIQLLSILVGMMLMYLLVFLE